METRFTLGIEEEFQLVDLQTGELRSHADAIIAKGADSFGEQLKQEMSQSMIELISNILPDIVTARKEICTTRAALSQLVEEEGLAIISAGTHPSPSWRDQKNTEGERFIELAQEYQDVVDDLGSRREIEYLHTLLDDKQGTGADRQIAVYRETESTQKVIVFLLERTMQGVER